MAKSFACKDMGMACSFTARAANEDDLMRKVAEHAKNVHNIRMDDETKRKIKAVIKEA
ncbi:Uncharacterised protein [uncultured archaeon]|nr:Uncharacterised protein [uncultured archaeon]